VFGVSAGAEVTIDLRSVYRRSIRLLGNSGFGVTPEETRKRLELVLDALADRTVTGKIVLRLDS
jgi:hypothetical protein